MICLQIQDKELLAKVTDQLNALGVNIANASGSGPNGLNYFYDRRVKALVVERNSPGIHNQLWSDVITNVARRIPVLVLMNCELKPKYLNHLRGVTFSHIRGMDVDSVASTVLGWLAPVFGQENFIPSFDERFVKDLIREQKFMQYLRIDGSLLNKIETSYGKAAHERAMTQFRKVISSVCQSENLLPEGHLFRSDNDSNLYYLVLPKKLLTVYSTPGKLETLANDLCFKLQAELWNIIYLPDSKQPIPIQNMPLITVGYATAVYNMCIDDNINLQKSLEISKENAHIQGKRVENRRREFIQAVVQQPEMLIPKFQGFFEISKIKTEHLEGGGVANISVLHSSVLGFESLIRLDVVAARKFIEPSAEKIFRMETINPDVLFSLAKSVKFNLELDQVCIRQAMQFGRDLPGALMINILPRNLYNFDKLLDILSGGRDVIFEVSEAEAINNFELMIKIRSEVKRMNMRIAADDFGVGYAGFDRIIQLEPDIIKLDRSLVSNINLERSKKGFLKGVIDAGKKLGAKVLAEGVETIAELEVLRSMDVDYVQGYLLHRPESASGILGHFNLKASELKLQEEKDSETSSNLPAAVGAA